MRSIKPPEIGERVWYQDPAGLMHKDAVIERVQVDSLEVDLRYGPSSTLAANVPHSTALANGTWRRPGKLGNNAVQKTAIPDAET
jgi:hypothetical protein